MSTPNSFDLCSVPVGKRSQTPQIQCKGLFPGAQVKPGRDWKEGSELSQMTGRVVGITSWEDVPRSAVTVNWSDMEIHHRVGYQGKVRKF